MRKLVLAALLSIFPAAIALAGVTSIVADQSGSSLVFRTGGEIKSTAKRITPLETRAVLKRYRSMPGDGMIRAKAKTITPAETRAVLKRYRSMPGDGLIKARAKTITPAETRTVFRRYRSIPGDGMIRAKARTITPAETRTVLRRYRSMPGGFLLEGRAQGLPAFRTARYDAGRNALVLDERYVYALPIPAGAAATLARAIAADDRLGVSLAEDDEIVYGRLSRTSDVAIDLKLADNFLGDMILPPQEWTSGYKFANGVEPRRNVHRNTAVFFKVSDFRFAVKDGKIELISSAFDTRLVPVVKTQARDGGYLPDLKTIETGNAPEDYLINAGHIADNITYYVQEDVVGNAFAYGQAAAFFRALKAARVGLGRLARSLEAAATAAQERRRFVATTLEANWLEYLQDIQSRNRFGNWMGPPADLYLGRIKNAAAPAN
jgi:hypothetical protein